MCICKTKQHLKIQKFIFGIVLLISVSNLSAAEEKPIINNLDQTGDMSAAYLSQFVVGLLVVLLCIIALAWIAKRFNRLQSSVNGELQVLGGLSMGARERIVLVKVGDEQLLLGVSPGRINALHVMDAPIVKQNVSNEHSFGKDFAKQLNTALSRDKS